MHKNRPGILYKLTAILFAVIFAGCGAEESVVGEQTTETSNPGREGMLDEASIEYVAPTSVPSIIVDLVGYLPDSEKKAIISSVELPETYSIKDAATGEEVFSGEVKVTDMPDQNGNMVGIADFTDFVEPGEYRIEAPHIGTGKVFSIREGIYETVTVIRRRSRWRQIPRPCSM